MTESEIIDEILNALNENRETSVKDDPNYRQGYGKAISYKLLESRGKFNFVYPTEKGYEVIRAGGFDKWEQAKEKQASESHQATLDSAKATVDAAKSAKWSKYAAIVSAIAAIIAFILPSLLNQKPESTNNTDSTVSELRAKVDTLYSQLKVQSQIQKAKEVAPQIQIKK